MKERGLLMVVTAPADATLRADVAAGRRPCPEYIALERDHGVELVDWSALGGRPRRRTRISAARLALASIPRVRNAAAVLSDGEPVGIPLALAMQALRIRTPHLMIGHRLTAPHKRPFFTVLRSQRGITRILVHSRRQIGLIPELGIPAEKLALVHYHADTQFWRPMGGVQERLVMAAGREQRDYATLARASTGLDAEVFIADGSAHTPAARHARASSVPSNVRLGYLPYTDLRDMYGRAQVVVVPLLPNDFQAGVTTLLEAMAMGKAVIVSETSGQLDVVHDGVNGITVPTGDPHRLRVAIEFLLDHPEERERLGRNARRDVQRSHSLSMYAHKLADHLHDISRGTEVGMQPFVAGGER